MDVDPEVSRMSDPVPPLFWLCDPEGNSSSSSAESDCAENGVRLRLGTRPRARARCDTWAGSRCQRGGGRTPSRPGRGQTRRRSHQQVDPISPASCSSPVFTTRRSHHNARMLAAYMTRPARPGASILTPAPVPMTHCRSASPSPFPHWLCPRDGKATCADRGKRSQSRSRRTGG